MPGQKVHQGRMQLVALGVSAVLVHQGNLSSGHAVTVDLADQEVSQEKASQGPQARLHTQAHADAQDLLVRWGALASTAKWDPKAPVVLVASLADAAQRETVVCLDGVAQKATQARLENVDRGVCLARGVSVHRACAVHRESRVPQDLLAKPAILAKLGHVASEVKRTARLACPMKRKCSAVGPERTRNALHSGFPCVA